MGFEFSAHDSYLFQWLLQVRGAMEKYPPYHSIFAKLSYGESQMLDKAFYEEEVKRLCLAFEQQVYISLTEACQNCALSKLRL